VDLPERAFLKKGAKYRLLGGSSNPKLQSDDEAWDGDDSVKRVVLKPTSALYSKFCNTTNDVCNFAGTVTLNENLECEDGTVECKVDTVRVIQVAPGVFYEYLRLPCVQLTYYEDAKKLAAGTRKFNNMCGNPRMPIATEACCGMDGRADDIVNRPCEFKGERISYNSNTERCGALGGSHCDFKAYEIEAFCDSDCCDHVGTSSSYPENNIWSWTTASCSLQILVDANGMVATVHNPEKTEGDGDTAVHVDADKTVSFYSVHWERDPCTESEMYPTVDNNCGNGACTLMVQLGEQKCLCNTTVSEASVFSSMPSRENILSQLHIGAFDPAVFDNGPNNYTSFDVQGGVQAYRRTYTSANFTHETIFRVESDYGETIYLKNAASNITLGGHYNIRNPPNFMDPVEPTLRDAYYETDAVIDHLMHHDNTSPFVSKLLIQHFGISNPSPRYTETVASAFRKGFYQWTDGDSNVTFGDGRLGSLAATAAAIVLDREATTVVLDADPAHGSLKEPLIKVIGFMRSMNYQREAYSKLAFPVLSGGLNAVIGQMVYETPDIFSFFSPHFGPTHFQQASLVSPESQILSMTTAAGISNGLYSLITNGMSECENGYGDGPWTSFIMRNCYLPDGGLRFSPASDPSSPEEVVNELATLVTSGRLSQANRELIVQQYNNSFNADDADTALQVAQHLLISSPEFHSTNPVRPSGQPRIARSQSGTVDEPYKAIVYAYLFGGMDSFYMLAPHESCDLYKDYADTRTDIGKLDADWMVSLNASSSNQHCDTFGLHKDLGALKTLYDAKEGMFFANIGHLSKPVTKDNYFTETKTQLFSHSTMMFEAAWVDAFKEKQGTGILGRMLDILQDKNYSTSSYGIDVGSLILNGDLELSRPVQVVPNTGLLPFYPKSPSSSLGTAAMRSHFRSLNGGTDPNSGLFGDIWSQELIDTMSESLALKAAIDNEATYNKAIDDNFDQSSLGRQLAMVLKLIKTRSTRQVNRDAFFVRINGFDTHATMKHSLDEQFPLINSAIEDFTNDLKEQNIFESVTLVLASEFGRSITPNSRSGTDHGWGGNTFITGGGLKGGQILGEYPNSFSTEDPTNDGKGRLIPTTSWEAMWNGIAQWFGVTGEAALDSVLPNRNNFGCNLFTDKDLYVDGNETFPGCEGEKTTFVQKISSSEPIDLTGKQQKKWCEFCKDVIKDVVDNSTIRCYVESQIIDKCGRRRLSDSEGVTTSVTISIGVDALDSTNAIQTALSQANETLAAQLSVARQTEQIDNSIVETIAVSGTVAITESPSMMPSDVPSDAPSDMPSSEPSMMPSDEPSEQPSSSPSISQAPSQSQHTADFNWEIYPLGLATVVFGDEHSNQEIDLNYNVSNKALNVLIFESDCKTYVAADILSRVITPEVNDNSYIEVGVGINVHEGKIQDDNNGVWSSIDPSSGEIKFCVMVELYTDDSMSNSVNFHETVITLTVDMSRGFTMTNISTDRDDASVTDKNVTANYTLLAYRCDESRQEITEPQPVSQGDDLLVCVESTTDNVIPVEIDSFDLIQDGVHGGQFSPVTTGGNTNDFSEVSCSGSICTIHTMVISSFFNPNNSGNIQGSGKAVLAFSQARRLKSGMLEYEREENDSTRRILQDRQTESSGFGLDIEVNKNQGEKQPSAIADARNKTASSSVILIVCILILFAAFLAVFLVVARKRRRKQMVGEIPIAEETKPIVKD